jgi:hypothetical protein
MADNALVEGVIWDTMDLRRSVILGIWYSIVWIDAGEMSLRCAKDAEPAAVECGDGALTILWGSRGVDWAEALGDIKSRVGKWAIGQHQPRVFLPSTSYDN